MAGSRARRRGRTRQRTLRRWHPERRQRGPSPVGVDPPVIVSGMVVTVHPVSRAALSPARAAKTRPASLMPPSSAVGKGASGTKCQGRSGKQPTVPSQSLKPYSADLRIRWVPTSAFVKRPAGATASGTSCTRSVACAPLSAVVPLGDAPGPPVGRSQPGTAVGPSCCGIRPWDWRPAARPEQTDIPVREGSHKETPWPPLNVIHADGRVRACLGGTQRPRLSATGVGRPHVDDQLVSGVWRS